MLRGAGLLTRLLGVRTVAVAVDKDVGDATALAVLLRDGLVFVVWLGEFGDDVPGMDEARDVA